jgi:hypothetical protein
MSEIAALQNPGYFYLNRSEPVSEKTVIVMGVPRSGTSMIASALRGIGISLGDILDGAVMEDLELASALEANDEAALAFLIERRNSRYPIWGFKRPDAFRKMETFEQCFRNIHYIVTFRDPLAIALRNNLSMREKLLPALQNAAHSTADLLKFVAASKKPMLLVSYEKAVLDAGKLVDEVARFLAINLPPFERERVMRALPANREAYWLKSRIVYEGRFDSVSARRVRGWARGIGLAKPVAVLLFVDGVLRAQCLADQYREDLERAGKNGGYCAFEFELATDIDPSAQVYVEIGRSEVRFVAPR